MTGSEAASAADAKIFVGNLAFKTRDEGLKEAFEQVGPVESVRVVTQGRRSMGYGFVQFKNSEDAIKAVEQWHRKKLDEREINVERSTSANPNPSSGSKPRRRFPKRTSNYRPRTNSKTEPRKETSPSSSPTPKEAAEPKEKTDGKPAGGPRRRNFANKPRTTQRRPSAQKTSRPPRITAKEHGVESETGIFVSNLAFSLNDDDLKNVFAEFNPVSANVIVRLKTKHSKGFGFVEFKDSESRQKAIDAKHKAEVEGREISVKKAYLRPPTPENTAPVEENTTADKPVETPGSS